VCQTFNPYAMNTQITNAMEHKQEQNTLVKPRMPDAIKDEECNMCKMRNKYSARKITFALRIHLPETDTPRRKKIRRLSFM